MVSSGSLLSCDAMFFSVGSQFLVKNAFFFQLFSNDLALNYVNVSVEPFGDLSVSEGVPFNQQHTGIVTVFEYIF